MTDIVQQLSAADLIERLVRYVEDRAANIGVTNEVTLEQHIDYWKQCHTAQINPGMSTGKTSWALTTANRDWLFVCRSEQIVNSLHAAWVQLPNVRGQVGPSFWTFEEYVQASQAMESLADTKLLDRFKRFTKIVVDDAEAFFSDIDKPAFYKAGLSLIEYTGIFILLG